LGGHPGDGLHLLGWWASIHAESYLQSGRWTLRNSMAGVSVERIEDPWSSRFPDPLFDGALHEPHSVTFTIEQLPPPHWVRGDGRTFPGMNQWFLYGDRTLRAWDHRSYLELTQKYRPVDDWILFLPHWLLLLLSAALWSLLLLWRARLRRKVNAMQSGPPDPPQSSLV
jgi:hypothetical protein